MNYTADLTARLVIEHSFDIGKPVTHLCLQKILYYIQAAALVETGEPFFTDPIMAWKYGPVIQAVYDQYSWNAAREIQSCRPVTREELPTTEELELVERVLESYQDYTGSELINKTTRENPYMEASKQISKGGSDIISNDSIRKYYSRNRNLIYGEPKKIPEWIVKRQIENRKEYLKERNQMDCSAILAAKLIINHAIRLEKPITGAKLQYLLYYVQAVSLVETSEPFFDDPILADKYGPVIENVRDEYLFRASRKIDSVQPIPQNEFLSDEKLGILRKVVSSYQAIYESQMLQKIKDEDPWIKAFAKTLDGENGIIRNSAIWEYYWKHQDLLYQTPPSLNVSTDRGVQEKERRDQEDNGYPVDLIARMVIDYSIQKKDPVSNMKLQKLLYYIQAASLVELGIPAFEEEILAWKFGPTVSSVYNQYRINRAKPITQWQPFQDDEMMDEDRYDLMLKVIDSYNGRCGMSIALKICEEEDPWIEVYDPENEYGESIISKERIKAYYLKNPERIYGKKYRNQK